ARDATANRSVIDATKTAGIERFILLSRIGAGDSADAPPWYVQTPVKIIHGKMLAAATESEDYVRASGLDYTIVRVGGFAGEAVSGSAILNTDRTLYSQVTRADAAKLIATAVDDTSGVGKTFSIYDPTRAGFLALFG